MPTFFAKNNTHLFIQLHAEYISVTKFSFKPKYTFESLLTMVVRYAITMTD